MPRLRKAMKDVAGCDKLRGVPKQTLIRRFPNEETQRSKPALSHSNVGCLPAEVKHLSKRRKIK